MKRKYILAFIVSILLTERANAFFFECGDACKLVTKPFEEIIKSHTDIYETIVSGKCHGDVCIAIEKGIKDTTAAVYKGAADVDLARSAIIDFYKKMASDGPKQTISANIQRIKEGKIIDALWYLGTDHLRHAEQYAAEAAQESNVVAAVGQIAATAYGGPYGAAAYAAWLTYHQTKDLELSLRVGIVSGALRAATLGVAQLPSTGFARNIVVSGALAGVAVAVSGGDEASVREGFYRGAITALVLDTYNSVTGVNLDGRSSIGNAFCMNTTNPELNCAPKDAYLRDIEGNIVFRDGKPVIDESTKLFQKIDYRRPHVGVWSTDNDTNIVGESSVLMTAISRIPGMNAMAVFHDQLSVMYKLDGFLNVSSIVPATIFTYYGTGNVLSDFVREKYIEDHVSKYKNLLRPIKQLDPIGISMFASSNRPPVASAYCSKGDVSRYLAIEQVEAGAKSCRVVLYSNVPEEESMSLNWNSDNLGGKSAMPLCLDKVSGIMEKNIELGWKCFYN